MNNAKYSKVRPFSFNGGIRSPRNRVWGRLHYNVGLIILAGVSALIIMFGRESSDGTDGLIGGFKRMISSPTEDGSQETWDYSSFRFQPNVVDWDEHRLKWTAKDLNDVRPRVGEKPLVMMVSGSSPEPCVPTILSHLLLRASKNKLDYSMVHDLKYFHNFGDVDPDFSDWWVKLPVIRMLMLQHPEVEWVWWLDADAVITDLAFEPPYAELGRDNLVLYGEEHHVYDRRAWTGLSTSNFMIRNCQWSLDLLDQWASMGTSSMREQSGMFLSGLLADRPLGFPGDDQSSLVALLAQDKRKRVGKQRWAPMVKLVKETEYYMTANWTAVVPTLEELSQAEKDRSVPFVTHFAGCLPSCRVKPELEPDFFEECVEQLGRAFDFADNQVYNGFGFQPRKLGSQLDPFEKAVTEGVKKEFTADGEEIFHLSPWYPDWDERRLAWMRQYPPTKRDEVMLVSGSAPQPCDGRVGSHMLLRGLKNLIDYSRKNDVRLFYNNAAIDKNLTGWWSKLPLLKMLMIDNPGTEWIWWLDSDAVITDMDYRFDFARYNGSGYNVVMYGDERAVYEEKSYTGINTGNFLIRNCQWSMDLLDRWGSFGATHELRVKNEDLLNNFLSDRPHGWDADDQCVLVYLLIAEREKWGTKACLETSITMSGTWQYWTALFRSEFPAEERPFVTHFAGCKPCHDPSNEVGKQCLKGQDITYNFVDNQVLQEYDHRHVRLNSTQLLKRSSLNLTEDNRIEELEMKALIKAESGDVLDGEQKGGDSDVEDVDKVLDTPDLEEVESSKEETVKTSGKLIDASEDEDIEISTERVGLTAKGRKAGKVDKSEEDSAERTEGSAKSTVVKGRKPVPEQEDDESELLEEKKFTVVKGGEPVPEQEEDDESELLEEKKYKVVKGRKPVPEQEEDDEFELPEEKKIKVVKGRKPVPEEEDDEFELPEEKKFNVVKGRKPVPEEEEDDELELPAAKHSKVVKGRKSVPEQEEDELELPEEKMNSADQEEEFEDPVEKLTSKEGLGLIERD